MSKVQRIQTATPTRTTLSGQINTSPARPQEFDRFAELAAKLVRVPKAEVDDLRKSKD
jgi:hypothetical protein